METVWPQWSLLPVPTGKAPMNTKTPVALELRSTRLPPKWESGTPVHAWAPTSKRWQIAISHILYFFQAIVDWSDLHCLASVGCPVGRGCSAGDDLIHLLHIELLHNFFSFHSLPWRVWAGCSWNDISVHRLPLHAGPTPMHFFSSGLSF